MLRDLSVGASTGLVMAAAIVAIQFFPDHAPWCVAVVTSAAVAAAAYFTLTGDDL